MLNSASFVRSTAAAWCVLALCCLVESAIADALPDFVRAPFIKKTGKPSAAAEGDPSLAHQFPSLRAVSKPPYRVFTDVPPDQLELPLEALERLRHEFSAVFGDLILQDTAMNNIEVLFFYRVSDFRRYARSTAPSLERSAGFYTARNNRLVLVSQLDVTAAHLHGTTVAAEHIDHATSHMRALPALSRQGHLGSDELAVQVIRHEGAHQLFCHYGIHSEFALEPTWITEGLAEYCVPSPLGASHPGHLRLLQAAARAKQLLPLKVLLNHRDASGFFSLAETESPVAYAQSWALVSFLMSSRHRDGFLSLLRLYRDTPRATARGVEDVEPRQLLMQALSVTEDSFTREWDAWLTSR